jgi:arylsulfatase A-like enzyme
LLQGGKRKVHEIGVTEFAWSKSVRMGKYRYVYYPGEMFQDEYPEGVGELYDIESDPWEMKNLYFEKEYRDIVLEMKTKLMDFIVTTTRPRTLWPHYKKTNSQTVKRYGNSINHDGKISPNTVIDRVKSKINYV